MTEKPSLPSLFYSFDRAKLRPAVREAAGYTCLFLYFQATTPLPKHVVPPKWIQPSHSWGTECVSNIDQSLFSSKSNHSSMQRLNVTLSLRFFFPSAVSAEQHQSDLIRSVPQQILTMSQQFCTIWAVGNQRRCVWRYRDCACHRIGPLSCQHWLLS